MKSVRDQMAEVLLAIFDEARTCHETVRWETVQRAVPVLARHAAEPYCAHCGGSPLPCDRTSCGNTLAMNTSNPMPALMELLRAARECRELFPMSDARTAALRYATNACFHTAIPPRGEEKNDG